MWASTSIQSSSVIVTAKCGASEIDPRKPWTKLDFAGDDNELDSSLFDDPSSGMRLGQAEELSSEEMEHRVKVLATKYDPVIFTTVFLPIVDIIELMLRHRLIPVIRPEVAISRWFSDPMQLLADSSKMVAAMSEERWLKYKEIITDFTEELLPTSAIYRIAKKHDVSTEIAVPLMRQLGAEVAFLTGKKSQSLSQIPQFVLSLSSGKAPAALNLPANATARAKCVAELLVATAQEVGQPLLGFLGLQLIQAAGLEVEYVVQKRMTNVFCSSHRMMTDWDLRSSGRLLQAFPSWVHSYFKLLRQDNRKLELEGFVMDTYTSEPRLVDEAATAEGVVEGAAGEESVEMQPDQPMQSRDSASVDSYFAPKDGAARDFFTSSQLAKIIHESVVKKASAAPPSIPSRFATSSITKSITALKAKSKQKGSK